jgi:subtilisin family serine protease/PKD repeat protein
MKKLYVSIFLAFFMLQLSAQNVYQWYQDGVVVFQLKTNQPHKIPQREQKQDLLFDFLEPLKEKYKITEVYQLLPDYPDEKLIRTYQINFDEIYRVEDLIKEVASQSTIEYAEKKELHVKFLTPNDLGANSTSGTGMWHLYNMRAPQAWDLSTGSAGIVVAVTDDAIRTTHEDLTGKFVAGNDATNQNSTDPNPCGGNDGNHGTHVAGTVGARTNNGLGVASIGWNVSIMPVKIGRCSDGALTAGYEGVAWAANNGAHVINMSWGGAGTSTFGLNTVNAAYNQGAILVAAAGNDGTTQQFYPAAYTNVIAVASIQSDNTKSSFSQYGSWINISAPGSAIRSTWATSNTAYNRIQGTSMASPNVAGLLGLMKSFAPNASRDDIINCLYSTAAPVNNFPGQMGAGRIDAFAALQCLQTFLVQNDAGITEILQPATTVCGNTFTPSVVLRNFGSNTLTSVQITYEWNGTPAVFNWTGSLTAGQTATVNLPQQTASNGNYTFTAFTTAPNGQPDENNANNSSSRAFTVDASGQIVNFTLVTDCYGSETTWNIRNENNVVVASGGPYTNVSGGQTFNLSFCLSVGCYTFTINDSYGDGLFGSQWQNCSVNGNYFATGPGGIPLFQMTAPNGNFGNSATHNFCLINPNINHDAGIVEVLSPTGVLCSGTINPQVRIQNFGNQNLTSAIINYNVGGGNQTQNWTGNLSTGQSAVVTLSPITAASGNVTFTAFTTLPNGQPDENPGNDQSQSSLTVYSGGVSLPFTESFESNSFNTNLWTIDNPDGDVTWDIVTVGGNTPGNRAARMNFFNYTQASQRDGMITPLINLSGYANATLDFEHAYRRFVVQGSNQPAPTDSLVIYVSTDCGASWQRVFQAGENGSGSFATTTASNQAFTPAQTNDWCLEKVIVNGNPVGSDCYTVDLTPFVGNQIFVKFEGMNAGTQGNNLFIDNINITGTLIPFQRDASVSAIIAPTGSICGSDIIPLVQISNLGATTLTTVNVNYQLNGGTVQVFPWSGSLASGASTQVQLPLINAVPGNNNLTVFTSMPNGQPDENPSNDSRTEAFTINVLSAPSASVPSPLCANENEIITATPASAGDIVWYNDLGATSPVGTGNNLTVNLPVGTYQYFVQEIADSTSRNVGPNQFFNGAFFTSNTARFLYFDVFNEMVLKSVLVNANGAGNRTIQLRNAQGVVLQERIINIPAGISRVTLNFQIAPGTNYQLGLGGTTNGLWRSDDAANINYPYVINNIVSIKESDVGIDFNPPEPNRYYYAFYDWEVARVYCTSERVPVALNVVSCSTDPVPDFTVSAQSICAGQQLTFTDQSTGTITSRSWSFPGGSPSTSTAANPVVTYNTAGTYSVTLTVNGSFTETKTNYITVNAAPSVNISGNSSFCTGGSTVLTANASAGSGTITTYQWRRNGTNVGTNASSFTANQAGTYSVVVTNSNGCSTTSANFSVTVNSAPTVSISGSNTICSNGTVLTANASAGSGSITSYQWLLNGSNVGTNSSIFTATQAGTYTVVVTNSNSCSTTSAAFNTTLATPFTIDVVTVDAGCGLSNGSATASVGGTTAGYTFVWNTTPPVTGSSVSNLGFGSYTLTVTQNSTGCSQTQSFTIGNIGQPVINNIATTDATCFNGGLGSATASVSGGDGNYQYNWGSGFQSSNSVSGLQGGNYTLTVTDGQGCQALQNFTINSIEAPVVTVVSVENASCIATANGGITVSVSGGSGSYSFEWSNGATSQNLENVAAGSYSLTVSDANGCSAVIAESVGFNGTFVVDLDVDDNASSGGNSSITAVVSGGQSPYTFNWNNGAFSGETIDNLPPGSYTVVVTDAAGCSVLSDTVFIGTVSIRSISLIDELILYPNPATTKVTLELRLNKTTDIQLSVFNAVGQIMWSRDYKDFNAGSEQISVDNFASGVYFIRVQAEESTRVLRFVKSDK